MPRRAHSLGESIRASSGGTPAWGLLAAPALSLTSHAALLALAALLVAERASPLVAVYAVQDPLLAFDLVEAAESGETVESAPAVDRGSVDREDMPQGAAPVRGPAPAERPATSPPIAKPAPSTAEPPPAEQAEATEPAPAGGSAHGAPPASASGAGAGVHGDPAAIGAGGGPRRDRRPDLVERFAHDLPSLAFGVAAWSSLPAGESDSITVVLAIDEQGQVLLRGERALSAPRCAGDEVETSEGRCARTLAALESARRTMAGLHGQFDLPGAMLGAGRVELGLVATLSGSPSGATAPPAAGELPVELASTSATAGRARAHFVKSDGRRVDFALEVRTVEPTPGAAPPTPIASSERPGAAP